MVRLHSTLGDDSMTTRRKFLQTEMDKFLSGEEYAQAEGYVPPSE